MTLSESKFRTYFKKKYPSAFLKKMPDFKSCGVHNANGFPDYIMILGGRTSWHEVKVLRSSRLSIRDFTPAQVKNFYEMLCAGADITVHGLCKNNVWVEIRLNIEYWRGLCKNETNNN